MQFLKTIFWVLVAVAGALFSFANWRPVDIRLWGDLIWSPPLPFPILIAFLIGLVPMLIVYRATRWSLRRRLDSVNRQLGDPIAYPNVAVPVTTVPPGAAPIVPPAGVA